MRLELESHVSEILESEKLTFLDLAGRYEQERLIEAMYSNGVEVAGRRSLTPLKAPFRNLKEHFGARALRSIKWRRMIRRPLVSFGLQNPNNSWCR